MVKGLMNSDHKYTINQWRAILNGHHLIEDIQIISQSSLSIKLHSQFSTITLEISELNERFLKANGNLYHTFTGILQEKGLINDYKNTIVGFFDIQAYKDYIDKTPYDKSFPELNDLLRFTKRFCTTHIFDAKVDTFILSDSIILVIDTSKVPVFALSLESLLSSCSHLLQESLEKGFPLRGAIGGGDFFFDGELLISSALVDAAKYERKQEWLGAVLTPNALKIIDDAKTKVPQDDPKFIINFTLPRFTRHIGFGKIPWKKDFKETEADSAYFIRPSGPGDGDWAAKFLPSYFYDPGKVKNSNILYALSNCKTG